MKIRYHTGRHTFKIGNINVMELNRDIKPENFLLKNKDEISNIKMIDFGLSKDYSETKIMQTPSGSVSYNNNKT